MMPQVPILETARLRLRAWRETDLESFANFYAHDPLARFVGGPKSIEDSWRHMAMIVGHWHFRGFGVFAIEPKSVVKSDAPAIGWCGPWFPHGFPEPEIGYVLFSDEHRGKGYISEAVRRSLTFAFDALKLTTIVSFIAPDNAASEHVARSNGAKLSGQTPLRFSTVNVWRYPAPPHLRLNEEQPTHPNP